MDNAEIAKRFSYHAPKNDQAARYQAIRNAAADMAGTLEFFHVPDSREKSLALTALEECVMWANAAIARNE
jgi:hypothetical protein